ncbi:MAG: hypothetical protein PUC73_00350 [Lachnospiraceae bacterium]|nr:hypothetical protein [Lachnospiraceae bacterium]
MKRKLILLGIMMLFAFGIVACGKAGNVNADSGVTPSLSEELTPTEAPGPAESLKNDGETELTAVPEPTKEAEPTQTPEPTKEAEPTQTPEPTKEAEPTQTPEPTKEAEPTPSSEPTKEAEPTPSSEPTKEAEPTKAPDPTATPKPTATPIPTPKPGAEVTIHFYAPLIVKDLSEIEAADAMEFLNKMSEYAMEDMGTATETAMLSEVASEYFNAAEKSLLKSGTVMESAEACYGEGVSVMCIGWYSEYGRYYSTVSSETFAELGVEKGAELNLYAAYTVMLDGRGVAYTPCILDVNVQMGFLNPTMKYMMAMPIWERVVLPELDGYTMEWVDNGVIMSPTKIRIFDGKINRYTLVVKPK